ncbi:MAG: Endonuclease III [Chlamydiae bacterium]|nr:Endonuclease III [Chlamydiota bacterium]
MNKIQRVAFIRKTLSDYYPNPPIPLKHHDPYTLLIAVVLSARSTDNMVNRVTPHLFARAKTPEQMVELSVEEIRQIIKPCGLSPQKSQAIHTLSHILLDEHEAQVPRTFEELEALPGVGHKTASVVLSQAYGIPAFPVDTHIFRSARRWGLSQGKTIAQVEKDLKKCFRKDEWIPLHLQIIYFAREFCPSRGHNPENCPICSHL